MEQQIAIFAASLAAVAALVGLAHLLGFSAKRQLADESQAREVLALVPGGFRPETLVLDADGRGAIGRDHAGRLAVVVPHGGRLLARVLGPAARLWREGEVLIAAGEEIGPRPLRIDPRADLPDWARSLPPAS